MFYYFFALIVSIQTSDLTITLGTFNSESNPYAGKFPPFFLNGTGPFNVVNSLLRNYLAINFPKNQNPSFYNFSAIDINESVYNFLIEFMKDDAFFLVGINGFNKRVKILDPSTQDPYIFNQFAITVSDHFSTKDPTFLVKEMDSVALKKNTQIKFSFTLSISRFDNPPPEPNSFTFYLFLCGFASFLSSMLFFFLIRSKGVSVNIIQFNDIWSVNKFYSVLTLFSSIGVIYIISVPIFLIFLFRNSPKDFYSLIYLSFIGIVLATIIRCYVYHSKSSSNIPIALLFQSVFIIPYILSSMINSSLFDSFVGIGIAKSFFLIIFIIVISSLLAFAFTSFANSRFESKLNSFTKRETKCQFIEFVKQFFISFSLFLILKPLIDHLYSVFIDDYYIDNLFILSFCPLYTGIIIIISLLRLRKNLRRVNNSWQSNHFTLNFLTGMLAFLYLFADIQTYVHQKETFVSCLAFVISISFAISFIGMSISFFTSFFFTAYIFKPTTESPLEEGNLFSV